MSENQTLSRPAGPVVRPAPTGDAQDAREQDAPTRRLALVIEGCPVAVSKAAAQLLTPKLRVTVANVAAVG